MIRSYLKTAWRNLVRSRFYSLINLGGLSIGLAVGLLILLWVEDERGFDSFHRNAANIYKVENMAGTATSRQLWTLTAAPIGMLAKKQIPGVEEFVRIAANEENIVFRHGDKTFSEKNIFYTDPSIFRVFDFPLLHGEQANPFPDDNSVIITESMAHKYFDADDPVGKTISTGDNDVFRISGVCADFPRNSTFRADMLFPMSLLARKTYAGATDGRNLDNDFHIYRYNTFLRFSPGFNFDGFTRELRDIHLQVKPDDTDVEYLLLPLRRMHLFRADGSDGGYSSVRMFFIIAIVILAIACINYVNLSTARAMLRAKEVSLRKIVGASRRHLFVQFIAETAFMFLLATVVALGLVYLLIPVFNQVSGKELVIDFRTPAIWNTILITILASLVASSIYPAFLLSSFHPLKVLKGKINSRISDVMFRKILVVVQFTFSMVLMTSTIVIGRQLSYIRSKQLGYDKEHVLTCSLVNMKDHYQALRSELLKVPGVENVTAASINIIRYGGQTGNNDWEGKLQGETMMVSPMSVEKDFISFFKMKLVSGSAFSGSNSDSTHFILNEAAVKATGLQNPVGKRFRLWETEGTIIGVVKDFHFASMRQRIAPAVFYYQPRNYGQVYIKTNGQDASAAIASLEAQWKKYNAAFPFEYSFLDDTFDRLYRSEERTGWLYNIFAGIAIFISCLGLFGLAAYTAQVRTREIGVRKVLGSNVAGIVCLLAGNFIRLVLVAIVVAVPFSWYLMNGWLNGFAYRTTLDWTVFGISGLMGIGIALLTVSFQSVRAALANPVRSLRTE